jgi:hypothetical protein
MNNVQNCDSLLVWENWKWALNKGKPKVKEEKSQMKQREKIVSYSFLQPSKWWKDTTLKYSYDIHLSERASVGKCEKADLWTRIFLKCRKC